MGPVKENGSKRKATEEPSTPSDHKRIKSSHSEEETDLLKISPKGRGAKPIPFPEKVSNTWLTSLTGR
jgi:histone acetyltransferase